MSSDIVWPSQTPHYYRACQTSWHSSTSHWCCHLSSSRLLRSSYALMRTYKNMVTNTHHKIIHLQIGSRPVASARVVIQLSSSHPSHGYESRTLSLIQPCWCRLLYSEAIRMHELQHRLGHLIFKVRLDYGRDAQEHSWFTVFVDVLICLVKVLVDELRCIYSALWPNWTDSIRDGASCLMEFLKSLQLEGRLWLTSRVYERVFLAWSMNLDFLKRICTLRSLWF